MVSAFVGGTWLFVALYVLGRMVASEGWLALDAAVVTKVRRKPAE
jgi:hypothetical protein